MTFLGVSKKFTICQEAKQVNTKQNLHFECLEPHHFVPEIVETYPYEQLSHAVLNWVEENADRCDVIHGHEWGGAFVDLITANNYRQVCVLLALVYCWPRDSDNVTCRHVKQALNVLTATEQEVTCLAAEVLCFPVPPVHA